MKGAEDDEACFMAADLLGCCPAPPPGGDPHRGWM